VATAVTIDSVTTEDAAPTTAPHKISNQTGKNLVTVKFTATTTDASRIRAWIVRWGGSGRTTGTRLAALGIVCGIGRCGLDRLLSVASGFQVTVAEHYTDLPSSADGTYRVNVYALSASQGWNP
jgi:hypothetical protein